MYIWKSLLLDRYPLVGVNKYILTLPRKKKYIMRMHGLLTVPEQLRWLEHLAGTSLSSQQTSHCTPASYNMHDALHGQIEYILAQRLAQSRSNQPSSE